MFLKQSIVILSKALLFYLGLNDFDWITRESDWITRGFDWITEGFGLITRGFDWITRVFGNKMGYFGGF